MITLLMLADEEYMYISSWRIQFRLQYLIMLTMIICFADKLFKHIFDVNNGNWHIIRICRLSNV